MTTPIRACALALTILLAGVGAAAAQAPTAILIPGAGGPVPIDFLMRNRGAFASAGLATEVATSGQEAAAMARQIRASGRRAVIVGMSRGGFMTAAALASGAPVAGAVFVSSGMGRVRGILGSPARLPPTLVVHHRNDGCAQTSPADVPGFVAWSGGRARAAWIDTQGPEAPNPCGPRGAHGFYMQDGPAVQAIIGFVRSR